MADNYLYQQIAENIRQEIFSGNLKPGDRLPSLRNMASQWNCTVGTVQKAYQELSRQGLVISHAGQGTKVANAMPDHAETPLRRAALVHRAESFLLEVFATGYSPSEAESAVSQALDRWRILETTESTPPPRKVRFSGSHDLFISWLAGNFFEVAPGFDFQVEFVGSLGGLIALAEGRTELAGCHLWDQESDTYNLPFVRRLLPGQKMAVQTLAHRRLGLILPKGNPNQVTGLEDLMRPELSFINRQPGSGSRVWLDANLQETGLQADQINGYRNEKRTHLEIALAIAEHEADLGLGLEAAADRYGLDFLPLTLERYDLIIPAKSTDNPPVRNLMDWLTGEKAKVEIAKFMGYDSHQTGRLVWINL
jgi:molybdate-binding protein/DNA-binding transcriptional regulator YhcF (GntR family)